MKTLFDYIIRFSMVLPFFFMFISCQGWEPVEAEHTSRLNVLGLLAIDDSLQSFIIVHKTLPPNGPDQRVVGLDTIHYESYEWYDYETGLTVRDTFFYDVPLVTPILESLYAVKNAIVRVSDRTADYEFILKEREDPGSRSYDPWYNDLLQTDDAVYIPADPDFRPTPETDYFLNIETPGGLSLSGRLSTPALPQIRSSLLPDTLDARQSFTLSWRNSGIHAAAVNITLADPYGSYICGAERSEKTRAGDSTWTLSPDPDCLELSPGNEAVVNAEIIIKVRLMDDNYNSYFGIDSDMTDINNFLIGEGNIGLSFGIDGGYGLFGSYATARITRILSL